MLAQQPGHVPLGAFTAFPPVERHPEGVHELVQFRVRLASGLCYPFYFLHAFNVTYQTDEVVFNNFVVSFLARRRSMAVLFSVGMSRRQGAGTLLIEAGSGGLIGGATGISAGFLLIRTVPAVLRAVNLSVTPVTPGRCS
jgi:hypothetical protein